MSQFRGLNRDERRQRVLLAADALLRSRSVDWGRLFTYDELSTEAGIDRKQIADDFGSKALIIDALVEFYLHPSRNFAGDELDTFAAYARSILDDRSLGFTEGIRILGTASHVHARRGNRLAGRLALWSLAKEDPKVSSRLQLLYKRYNDEYDELLSQAETFFAAKGVKTRTGITNEEFITILASAVEGLSIHADMSPGAVSEDLPSKMVLFLVESYFTDLEGDALGSRLDAWEAS